MKTGLVESWSDGTSLLGPIYPFVGHEAIMMVACVAVCLGFIYWKLRSERIKYDGEVHHLRSTNRAPQEGDA